MLNALGDPVLPIFAIGLVGYILRLKGAFSVEQARTINTFVFNVAGPALVFSILATAPVETFKLDALALYFAAEVAVYASVALICRYVFGIGPREALLLGMAAAFSNHVFFVRPIAVELLGPEAAHPISGVIVMDVLVFTGSILMTEFMSPKTAGTAALLRSLIRNPFIITPPLAVLYQLFSDWIPSGVMTYAEFVGAAASPASLFSLGVILAGYKLTSVGAAVWLPVFGKLVLHPFLFWIGAGAIASGGVWVDSTLLVAAGPCGAMAFVIALQYDVKAERIAKAVLISSALSVLSLSVLAAG